ncbi:MAG: PEP-CTERM sorting domain-containing protein [Sandarakinorhabdus sp.]|nr:PEP-CTERM sorting domain-containing protein [Sandarakinorhabdus sp.]
MKSLVVAGTFLVAGQASAAVFVVDSAANSSTGGVGLATFVVAAGQTIQVASSANDLWSLGALPRFSDADGLTGNRFASALDDSEQAVGTLIGMNFGLYTKAGYSAPYGALVGEIGGVYRLLGANGQHAAWGTGMLKLYNWDSNRNDNAGSIGFKVSVVPEPATWAMLIAGFGMVGVGLRRRRSIPASFSATA